MVETLVLITVVALIVHTFVCLAYFVSSIWEKEKRASIFAGLQLVLPLGLLGFVLHLSGSGFFDSISGMLLLVAGVILIVLAPVLLPWIPGRAFSLKGTITGLVFGLGVAWAMLDQTGLMGAAALMIFTGVISSYLAMNFTGSTPFTSPSGVEKEMRQAIPFQAGALILCAALWIGSAFIA